MAKNSAGGKSHSVKPVPTGVLPNGAAGNRLVLPWCWLAGSPYPLYVVSAAAEKTTIYSN